MAFPSTLDSFTNPTANQKLNSPSHSTIETAQNTALTSLEAKVGVNSSAVATSLDYKVTNASSVSPGHKHVTADLTDAGTFVGTGVVVKNSKLTAPTGYLLCNGAAVSRTTYATLFSSISTNFGIGDGATTFNVPTSYSSYPNAKYDATSVKNSTAATSQTLSHTMGGSDGILIVGVFLASNTITSITYGGVAMTSIDTIVAGPQYAWYYIPNPSAGAANIVVNFGGSVASSIVGVSYLHMSSPTVDTHSTTTTGSITTMTKTSTSSFPMLSVVLFATSDNGAVAITISNATARQTVTNAGGAGINIIMGELNAVSLSSLATANASTTIYGSIASFTPMGLYDIIKT